MTTVRISRLPEIRNDRLTNDDYFVVNDGNITTNRISFKELVIGISANITELPNDLTFTGDVIFEGSVIGDFYNKDQTYNKTEINQIIQGLEDYNDIQDSRINDLITLTGRPPNSTDLGYFTWGIIRNDATIKIALQDLENQIQENLIQIEKNRQNIEINRGDIDDLLTWQEEINIIINGNGQGPGDPGNIDGILEDIANINIKLSEHEFRIEKLEEHIVRIDGEISVINGTLDDHETRLTQNDNENANLIELSGVAVSGASITTTTHTLASVTRPAPNLKTWLSTTSPSTNQALDEIAAEINLMPPTDRPIFTGKVTGPSGTTSQSVIPFHFPDPASLSSAVGDDGTNNSTVGSFGLAQSNNTMYYRGTDASKGQAGWHAIFGDGTRGLMMKTLFFNQSIPYQDDANAVANGIAQGQVYAQDPSGGMDWEVALFKTNGVN